MKRFLPATMALLLVTSSAAMPAWAQDAPTAYVPADDIVQHEEAAQEHGFDGTLSIAGNLNITSNDSVVGQVDGESVLLGLTTLGTLDYLYGRHELHNRLKISQTWSRTPLVDEFIKGSDTAEAESVYHYFLFDWAGAFGRVQVETSLLPSEDVRPEPATYRIARVNGDTDTRTTARLDLTDAFQPLTLHEAAGVFAEPVQGDAIRLKIRMGLGSRETQALGALVIDDDKGTPEVEVKELNDVYQAGAEGFLGVDGALDAKRVTYHSGVTVLVPVINNDDTGRSALDLTRITAQASVAVQVYDWMSLNYTVKIVDDPQLIDEVQIQNNLLLTFTYALIEEEEEEDAEDEAP